MVTKCVYLYQYKTGNTIPSGWEFDSQGRWENGSKNKVY